MSSSSSFGLSSNGITPLSVNLHCLLRTSTVEAGQTAILDVSITNNTADDVRVGVGVYVDGSIDSSDTRTVQANDAISYQASISGLSAGSYDISTEMESVEIVDGGDGGNGDDYPCQCQGDGDCPTSFFCQDCICVPDRYRQLVT